MDHKSEESEDAMKTGDRAFRFIISLIFLSAASISYTQNLITVLIDSNQKGQYNSLALSEDGVVHIVYYDNSKDDLKYATTTPSGWQIYTIDSYGSVGEWASIALDSKGMPHISYFSVLDDNLKYAYQDELGWHILTADAQKGVGKYSSIAVDKNDKIHIAYQDWKNYQLKYATNASGQWKAISLPYSEIVMNCVSIAVDRNNRPHIITVFRTPSSDNQLIYIHYNGINWEYELPINTGSRRITNANIKLDQLNNPHIAFTSLIGYSDNRTKIYYLTKTGDRWISEIVTEVGGQNESISLALSRTGSPYIAYSYIWSGTYLGFFRKQASTWINYPHFINETDLKIASTAFVLDLYDQIHMSGYDAGNGSGSLVYIRSESYGPAAFSLMAPENGSWAESLPTFIWKPASYNGYKLARYEIEVDGISVNKNIPPTRSFYKMETALTNGWHTWHAKAVTLDGQEIWSTETWSFRIDATPPTSFQLLSPLNGGWVALQRPKFFWSQSLDDESGIRQYQIYVDELLAKENIQQGTSAAIDFDISDGPHQWYIKAIDATGNGRNSEEVWTVNVDISPPASFNLVSPAESYCTNDTRPSFSWMPSSDDGAGLKEYMLRLEKDSYNTSFKISKDSTRYTPSADFALPSGSFTWYVRAMDSVGNFQYSEKRILTIDLTAPQKCTLQTPADSGVIAFPTPEFSWNSSKDEASGLSHYELWIDNVINVDNLQVIKTAPSIPLKEGIHSWFVNAVDKAGNTAKSAVRTFFCDWDLPTTFSLIYPSEKITLKADSVFFKWNSSKDFGSGLLKYQLWVDGLLNWDNIKPPDTTATPKQFLTRGEHSWFIVALDRAGNKRQSNSEIKFNVTFPTGVDLHAGAQIPTDFMIYQNYPNPFNSTTTICYDIPRSSNVKLQIFNLDGQLVSVLINKAHNAGKFEMQWNGTDEKGLQVPSGIYICSMIADQYHKVIKLSLIK